MEQASSGHDSGGQPKPVGDEPASSGTSGGGAAGREWGKGASLDPSLASAGRGNRMGIILIQLRLTYTERLSWIGRLPRSAFATPWSFACYPAFAGRLAHSSDCGTVCFAMTSFPNELVRLSPGGVFRSGDPRWVQKVFGDQRYHPAMGWAGLQEMRGSRARARQGTPTLGRPMATRADGRARHGREA